MLRYISAGFRNVYKKPVMIAQDTISAHADTKLVFSVQHMNLNTHDGVKNFPATPTHLVDSCDVNGSLVPDAPKKNHLSMFRTRNGLAPLRLSLLFL
jgi:hypothetical protein